MRVLTNCTGIDCPKRYSCLRYVSDFDIFVGIPHSSLECDCFENDYKFFKDAKEKFYNSPDSL